MLPYGIGRDQDMLWVSIFLIVIKTVLGAGEVFGTIDLAPRNLTVHDVSRISVDLYQINSTYHQNTAILNTSGSFSFKNLPLKPDEDSYFVLVPSSLDYNLAPSRMLVQIDPQGRIITASSNIFGKEWFSTAEDERFQEELPTVEIESDGSVTFKLAPQPGRLYYEIRHLALSQNDFISGILNSRWKLALVISIVAVLLLPVLIDKLDPETSKLLKQDAIEKKRAQYQPKALK